MHRSLSYISERVARGESINQFNANGHLPLFYPSPVSGVCQPLCLESAETKQARELTAASQINLCACGPWLRERLVPDATGARRTSKSLRETDVRASALPLTPVPKPVTSGGGTLCSQFCRGAGSFCCPGQSGSDSYPGSATYKSVNNDNYSLRPGISEQQLANSCEKSINVWNTEDKHNDNFVHTTKTTFSTSNYKTEVRPITRV